MRLPIEWLKEHVAVRLSAEALADRLTMAGLEVTRIERLDGGAVLILEITPNRPDCLSIIGIAREIAVLTGATLKLPRAVHGSRLKVQGKRQPPRTSNLEPRTKVTVRIEDRQGCRRYLGRLIEGVAVGASPGWIQNRLSACGIRPINNVVDITNYVLLECGQPLHAFDADRLKEGAVVVRRAAAGETLVTIDEQARALSSSMLVIADARRPIAIAGVMGGLETAVSPATTRILLESAWFDPIVVRRTGRALGLSSESSYRFERGVDPAGVEAASRRAAQLIIQLAGGRETAVRDVGEHHAKRTLVRLDGARVQRGLGASIPPTMVKRTLESLGCVVRSAGGGWQVAPPSFRCDIAQDVDLLEEIARVAGYDRLPATMPQATLDVRRDEGISRSLRELCASLGLWEIVTWALVSEESLANIGPAFSAQDRIRLTNPLSRDHAILRPTLLAGMLQAIARNFSQGATGARFFELGNVFEGSAHPHEILSLGIGIAGLWEQSWQGARSADVFLLKGLIEQLAQRFLRQPVAVQASPIAWAEGGQSFALALDGQPLGCGGEVARPICNAFDCHERIWFAELRLETLVAAKRPQAVFRPLNPFPPVKRDLSVMVERHIELAKLAELIRTVGAPLVSRLELVDRYTGSPVPATKHSLTFSIEYRDPARTLTAAEVDARHRAISLELLQRFGAQLR
jgi:phenylalanyl-tRNA synthetase beta chain